MRYIWVMGYSATGKKTFIQRLERDAQLRERLWIPDGFVTCGPGFHGQKRLETWATELAEIKAPAVVIKWQAAGDLELEKLRRLRPDAEHHIFFLERPSEHIHRDLKRRDGETNASVEQITAWIKTTREQCRRRAESKFQLWVIDSTENQYVIVDRLPKVAR